MSTCSAGSWIKFFSNAGINAPMNATYAHIFVENRMQMDMLVDLNKEYLKEMGINPMGDIISILRHSKLVTDQNARDKILSANDTKAIVKIAPASSVSSSSTVASVAFTPARRVLPEHEGKYKISLPKGSTKRSREILAKHSMMKADKMEKKSIFERLTKSDHDDDDMEMADSTSNEPSVKIAKATSSIFNRLGNKTALEKKLENKSTAFSGILKNSPTKQPPRGIVKHKVNPKVMMVNSSIKNRMDTDESATDSDDNMDSDTYKQVSFSPDVEVLEIASRPLSVSPKKMNRLKGMKTDGIKARLGMRGSSVDSILHTTRKTIIMKPTKASPASKMKSDQVHKQIPVQNRVDLSSRSSTSQLTNRIKNFKLDSNSSMPKSTNTSVFNRLGINK